MLRKLKINIEEVFGNFEQIVTKSLSNIGNILMKTRENVNKC